MGEAFAGANYPAHLFESFASAMPGLGFGEWQRRRTEERMQPWADAATGQPGPRDTVPQGRGSSYIPMQAMNPYFQQFLANSGIGGVNRGGAYMFPQMPGQADIASALMQGSSNRFQAQQALEQAQQQAIGGFENALQFAGQNLQQGQQGVEGIRAQGQQMLGDVAAQGQMQLAGAQATNQRNLAMNLQAIQGQLNNFQQQANDLLGQTYDLRGDALRAHADQSANILNNLTTGMQQRLQAQEAELDARSDIPPMQREAMKQRLRFVNGSEVMNTAVQVTSQEAQRRDSIMAQHNQMISGALSTISSTAGALSGQAISAGTAALQQSTQTSMALAQARAELGQAFSNSWTNWTATTTQMAEGIRSALVGLQLQGRQDLFGMVSNVQRAYVDLSPELMDLMGLGLQLDEAAYNRSVNDYNVQASMYGLTQAQAMPFWTGAASSMTNALYADYVTGPMQNAAANRGMEASGMQTAGSVVGAMFMSDQGQKQPYGNPYGSGGFRSDRYTKAGFHIVSPDEVLRRVTELPVTMWRYKWEPPYVKHIGPMAQDFYKAFKLGDTDRAIYEVDAVGVLMASVQALNAKVEVLAKAIKELQHARR